MTKGGPKIPAYLVLRLLSMFLAIVGVAALTIAGMSFLSAAPTLRQHGFALLTGGIILLLVGIAGPVRISLKGIRLPAEVRQTILVQAIVLPLAGIVLIVSGIVDSPASMAWALSLVGILVLVAAVVVFRRESFLPAGLDFRFLHLPTFSKTR